MFFATTASADTACTTIKSGRLLYSPGSYLAGTPYTTGKSPFGYNYQAHRYNGSYFNAYANSAGLPPYDDNDAAYLANNPAAAAHWAWPYRHTKVEMKWNNPWLANSDCDYDGKLDRHFGFPSYIGAGAWLTNNNTWSVTAGDKRKKAREFLLAVSIPAGGHTGLPKTYFGEKTVYAADGSVLGPQLWGEFFVKRYCFNDPSTGDRVVIGMCGDDDEADDD
jgi:hypothetical protein